MVLWWWREKLINCLDNEHDTQLILFNLMSNTFPLSATVISGFAQYLPVWAWKQGISCYGCSVSSHSRINWIRRIYGIPDCSGLGVMRTFKNEIAFGWGHRRRALTPAPIPHSALTTLQAFSVAASCSHQSAGISTPARHGPQRARPWLNFHSAGLL